MSTLTLSETTLRSESFEEATGQVGRQRLAAFVQVVSGMSLGTLGRTILAFAPCVIAATFGGVALTAWEMTMSLLIVESSDEMQTQTMGKSESEAPAVDQGRPRL